MISHNLFLFSVCSLIWGTTWLVIKFQLATTSVCVGVFYRFFLAAMIMFLFNALVTKRSLRYPLINHVFFILQGVFNFSLNYILTYMAELKLSSGLVALTFTTLVYFNMLGLRFWFKRPISLNVLFGGLLGAIGIVLLFWQELISFFMGHGPIQGVLIGIVATFFASCGNMFAYKNHQLKVPVVIFNSFGMLYGSFFTLIIALVLGEKFTLPSSFTFWWSLLYLALIGSVITFWAYQTLVGSIGADRAAYSSVISPMIAVIVSAVFENVALTGVLLCGIFFCLLGNIISLKKDNTNFIRKRQKAAHHP